MAKRWYYKDENGNKVPVPQYKINSDNHYTKSDADNKFATKENTDTKVAKTDIVQSVGNATDKIMSQKASTDSFIANTPSGDPMHNLYVSMGAVWNGTGKDIIKKAPWSDYVDNEEDKTYLHKTNCWHYGFKGDLNNADMVEIARWNNNILGVEKLYYYKSTAKVLIVRNCGDNYNQSTPMSDFETFLSTDITLISAKSEKLEIINFSQDRPNMLFTFAYNSYLEHLFFIIDINNKKDVNIFVGDIRLKTVFIKNLGNNLSLKDSPNITTKCIIYMINNATDATFTITLHPEAYERAIADAGVQTALANKTNVSLAKQV